MPVTVDAANRWVHPASELAPGEYLLTIPGVCDTGLPPLAEPSRATSITVVGAAPLPTSLGALVVSPVTRGAIPVWTTHGSCSVDLDSVSATVEVSPEALAGPWGAMLNYQVRVDGADWYYVYSLSMPPSGTLGQSRTTVFHACEDPASVFAETGGLDAGTHVVEIRGQVPGTDTWIASEPVTVDLQCAPREAVADGLAGEASGSCGVGASTHSAWGLGLIVLGATLLRRLLSAQPRPHRQRLDIAVPWMVCCRRDRHQPESAAPHDGRSA